MELFCAWLRQRGLDVIQCRDPGGTKLGETLREIILHKTELSLSPTAEMLLYMASRAQLVAEVIQPALAAGTTIVSDRFLLSNVAYQGYGCEMDVASVWSVGATATGGLLPTMTFLLDMSVDQAGSRLDRALDRIESRGANFVTRVREGFLREAERAPGNIAVIDATRDVATIQAEIRRVAAQVLDHLEP